MFVDYVAKLYADRKGVTYCTEAGAPSPVTSTHLLDREPLAESHAVSVNVRSVIKLLILRVLLKETGLLTLNILDTQAVLNHNIPLPEMKTEHGENSIEHQAQVRNEEQVLKRREKVKAKIKIADITAKSTNSLQDRLFSMYAFSGEDDLGCG